MKTILSFAILIFACCPTFAQNAAETWNGAMTYEGDKEIRMRLELNPKANGKFSGKLVYLEPANAEIVLDEVVRDAASLSFEFEYEKSFNKFDGKLDANSGKFSGIFMTAKGVVSAGFPLEFTKTTADEPAVDEPTEIWKGVLDAGIAKLRLQLEMTPDADGWKAKLISIDQGNAEMVPDSITRDEDSLSFEIRKLAVKYEGKIDAEAGTIEGTFVQAGQSMPLKFEKGEKAKPTTHIQTWQGTMDAGGRKFDFQFRVFQDEDEKLSAKLDSYSERIFGLSCTVEHGADGTITVEVPISKALYVGTLSDDMQTIDGKWKQAGGEFDLKLTQVSLDETRPPKAPERPQTPKGPFPYRVREMIFENSAADIKLAATLTVPKEKDKPPVAILINGSGPQDRDESIADHKPFWVVADHLSRNGIAVFRYDERGVGRSTGTFEGATSADLATDVEAAIDYLKGRRDVDPTRIILIGHSEGGLLAPMIAARRDDVAGVVLLAPPGVNGVKVVINQSRLIAEASGTADEEELQMQEKILELAFELLKSQPETNDDFYEQFEAKTAEVMGEDAEKFELVPEIEVAVRQLDTPWFRYFAKYEPGPALEKTKCPTLVLIGEKDLQVDPKLNLPPIKAALAKSGNQDVTIEQLSGLNHLFQTCESGSPSEYMAIEQTFAPKALKEISQWINKRFAD
ncbi:alpha/beta hydrolase family protein [Mariniblastus fucicola]|uniref:Alpha/beta hydrolase family protein n=1 Tax=Mariniblastus fucicola TaxID=980251 RepID=A0A5B9P4T9_9BACT|nr:alpha/beta hydrolase [Mariniblastus fucicola]QEG20499.1 Alpha/beta hydrolase family protein [Mariniblastus fucicola]